MVSRSEMDSGELKTSDALKLVCETPTPENLQNESGTGTSPDSPIAGCNDVESESVGLGSPKRLFLSKYEVTPAETQEFILQSKPSFSSPTNVMEQLEMHVLKCQLDESLKVVAKQGDSLVASAETLLYLQKCLDERFAESKQLHSRISELESTLEQTQDTEKDALQEEIRELKAALEESAATIESLQGTAENGRKEQVEDLQKTIASLREESQSKSEQIDYFEYKLKSRKKQADDLREQIKRRNQKLIALEVELEAHDCLYYAAMSKQIQLLSQNDTTSKPGSARPLRSDRKSRGGLPLVAESQTSAGSDVLSSEEYQKAIDIALMEKKLLREKYFRSKMAYEELSQKFDEQVQEIASLERNLRDLQLESGREVESPQNLQECVRSVEKERDFQQKLVEKLQSEIAELKKQSQRQADDSARRIEALQLENKANSRKLVQLELGDKGKGATGESTARLITKKQCAEFQLLNESNMIKDKKIETLTRQVAQQRMQLKSFKSTRGNASGDAASVAMSVVSTSAYMI